MSVWSTAFIDNLPDSSFAYIAPGGKKDSEGKTTPRSLRHLPYKDENGKADADHLRNALARLSQTDISSSAKSEAFRKLHGAAKEAGVDVSEEDRRKFGDQRLLKIPVGRIGEWKHPRYGIIKMSQQMFDQMKENFKSKAIGRDPYIRLGHDKAEDPTWGTSKAEGWITDLVQEGDTLFALAEPTNADIAQMVKNKQYRYSSAEYLTDYKDKETGASRGAVLEALALTNAPFLTRLPEAVLLADPPDTFYLDHEEVLPSMEKIEQLLQEQQQTNGFLRKLADFFTGRKPEDLTNGDGAGAGAGAGAGSTSLQQTEESKKLADQMTAMQQQLEAAQFAQRTAEVNAKLNDYIQAGIPPAVVEQYRPILLADTGEKTIKLSDDKTISLSDQVYAALDAFPENARVKFNQVGNSQQPPKPGSPEEVKKLADQDLAELGYEIDEKSGKFII